MIYEYIYSGKRVQRTNIMQMCIQHLFYAAHTLTHTNSTFCTNALDTLDMEIPYSGWSGLDDPKGESANSVLIATFRLLDRVTSLICNLFTLIEFIYNIYVYILSDP